MSSSTSETAKVISEIEEEQMNEISEEDKEFVETLRGLKNAIETLKKSKKPDDLDEIKQLVGHVNYLAIMTLDDESVKICDVIMKCFAKLEGIESIPPKACDILEKLIGSFKDKGVSDSRGCRNVESDPTAEIEKLEEAVEVSVSSSDSKQIDEENALKTSSGANNFIKVTVNHLDSLMNLMGEMVLVRNQVLQHSKQQEHYEFKNLSQRLDVVTNELQEQIMQTRMQPIGSVLSRYTRVVRDISSELGKEIKLILNGKDTELDRSLLEIIKDPLTHIVRNSCDHGIELPEERVASGKARFGTITVDSYHEGGQVIISISDDGKGLDGERLAAKAVEKGIITAEEVEKMSEDDKLNLIFSAGFSTASSVTNLSGRGVGMDVVKSNLEKIGGSIKLKSEFGNGMTLQLSVPLTLAIVPALTVFSCDQKFVVPQVKLVELVRYVPSEKKYSLEKINNKPVLMLRGELLPLVSLRHTLNNNDEKDFFEYYSSEDSMNVIVLDSDGTHYGLIVDGVEDTADIVVKPLSKLLNAMDEYSGVTVLGNGDIALILDVEGIGRRSGVKASTSFNRIDEDTTNLTDYFDMLQFELDSDTKFGINLSDVDRLEEIKAEQVERSGEQLITKYRDGLLRLVDLNTTIGGGNDEKVKEKSESLLVIVVKYESEKIGLIVNKILDVHSVDSKKLDINVENLVLSGRVNTQNGIISLISLGDTVEASGLKIKRTKSLKSEKILYIDNVEFFRKMVQRMLEKDGYEVVTVGGGEEALTLLDLDHDFDLVLTDIDMPKMDGFDFVRNLRNLPGQSHLPVVGVSSMEKKQAFVQAAKVGMNDFVNKSEINSKLKDVINSNLKRVA